MIPAVGPKGPALIFAKRSSLTRGRRSYSQPFFLKIAYISAAVPAISPIAMG
jgi:hypothetical protein